MSTVSVKLSSDAAKKLLSFYEAEAAELQRKLEQKQADVAELRNAIFPKGSEPIQSLPLGLDKNPESGRVKKGQSQKAIQSFLETHKGSGWSLAQIAEQTGTSLSTANRILQRLSKEGIVDKVGKSWGMAA